MKIEATHVREVPRFALLVLLKKVSSFLLLCLLAVTVFCLTISSCNGYASSTETGGKYPAFTCDSLYKFLKKKLDDRCSGYDYKNPIVKIETCHMGKAVSYVGSPERLAYPCTFTWMQQYDDFNSTRIEHTTNDYAVFARNIDTGKWEIIEGKNGEKKIETKYFKQ